MQLVRAENNRFQNVLKATGLSLGIILLAIQLNCIYYYQPDDYLMNYINRGSFGNTADPYVVFINVMFGRITAAFYNLLPQINWFGIMYISAVGFIFWALFYIFLEMKKSYISLIVIGILEFATMLCLTFTVIAYMGAAAFGAYCVHILTGEKRDTDKIIISLFLLMIGLGFRNGKKVLLSSLIIYIPVFWEKVRNIRFWKMKWYLLLVVFVCVFMWKYNGNQYYRNEFWSEYKEYNSVRSSVLDNPITDYEDNREDLERLGISQNDLTCLKQWIFADKNVYSLNTMRALADMNDLTEKREVNLSNIFKSMVKEKYNYLFAIFAVLFLVYSANGKRSIVALIALFTYILIAALFVRNRPVERVMIPIYFSGIIAIMFCGFGKVNDDYKKIKCIVEITVCVLLLIVSWYLGREAMCINDQKTVEKIKYEEVWDYIQNNQEYLFVGSSATINEMLGLSDIFNVGEELVTGNVMKLGTWDMYSSRYYSQVKKYNLLHKDSVLLSMVENDNIIYMVAKDYDFQTDYIMTFLKEHTKDSVSVELVGNFNESEILMYKCY